MSPWSCGISGCKQGFDEVEELIRHQAVEHPASDCQVCGEQTPAGYLAIRHAFEEHTRAEYVRAYDANSDEIRFREQLLDVIEDSIDVPRLVNRLGFEDEPALSVGD